MPHGVDARVQAAKPIDLKSPKDGLPSEAELDELPPGHHAKLPTGQSSEPRVERGWAPVCTICVTLGPTPWLLSFTRRWVTCVTSV